MRTVHFRSLATAAAAVIAMAGSVAAQERPTALVNSLEVRTLVARGEPADNRRLGAHFSALADQYTAEAKRHISMSQNFVGNPSRNLGTGMSAHCKRLADLNTQSTTTARTLAAYHYKLAGGGPATPPPPDGALFQQGAGAREPTEKELTALAAKALTPAEHKILEGYFLDLAKRYTAAAKDHTGFAQAYRGTRLSAAAVHHDQLARLSRDAAKEATEAAEMHKQLADAVR